MTKRKTINFLTNIIAFFMLMIIGTFVTGILYLIYMPLTRTYILSLIGISWLFTLWEIYRLRQKKTVKQEAK